MKANLMNAVLIIPFLRIVIDETYVIDGFKRTRSEGEFIEIKYHSSEKKMEQIKFRYFADIKNKSKLFAELSKLKRSRQ